VAIVTLSFVFSTRALFLNHVTKFAREIFNSTSDKIFCQKLFSSSVFIVSN